MKILTIAFLLSISGLSHAQTYGGPYYGALDIAYHA